MLRDRADSCAWQLQRALRRAKGNGPGPQPAITRCRTDTRHAGRGVHLRELDRADIQGQERGCAVAGPQGRERLLRREEAQARQGCRISFWPSQNQLDRASPVARLMRQQKKTSHRAACILLSLLLSCRAHQLQANMAEAGPSSSSGSNSTLNARRNLPIVRPSGPSAGSARVVIPGSEPSRAGAGPARTNAVIVNPCQVSYLTLVAFVTLRLITSHTERYVIRKTGLRTRKDAEADRPAKAIQSSII